MQCETNPGKGEGSLMTRKDEIVAVSERGQTKPSPVSRATCHRKLLFSKQLCGWGPNSWKS